jgi:hypothetical protein
MFKIKINLMGRDSVFIANSERYITGLENIGAYKGVTGDSPPSIDLLKQTFGQYKQCFEKGATGDRIQITMRNRSRKELKEMFQKAQNYLQAVASEVDLPALLQAGFELRSAGVRGKRGTGTVPPTETQGS